MWQFILSLFVGAVPSVLKQIGQNKALLANAKTDQDKIKAEENIKYLEAKRDILVAQSKSPWTYIAMFCLMGWLPPYLWWISVHDKIICKWYTLPELVETTCSTDPLGPWLAGIAAVIIGFYFYKR